MHINSMFVVFDPGTIGGVIGNIAVTATAYVAIAGLLINLGKYIILGVSWLLDKMLIGLIAVMYDYFEQILNGTMFTEGIVNDLMNRVYLLVGVFFVFRLGMLIIHYMINPAEVLEEKGGVNTLVKRAIVGLILIIFIPSIFDIANDLQAAILKDQVIERVILNENQLEEIEEMKKEYGTGRIIGMLVFQGFWNIDKNQTSDSNLKRAYDEAVSKMDPALVEDYGYKITDTKGDKFIFNYFPILSTVVLGYVLYLIIKYCLDLVVRLFKLLILQIISPLTIIEYIINGDRNEVFAKWKTSVIANYAMVFIRTFSLWFVVFVAYLLREGVAGESLLNTQDHLLKAIIVLGLLAFMMEFPKMISDILGLDLEQDSAVKGVLGKVATAGKIAGGAALMAGGAALGGIAGAVGGNVNAYKQTKKAAADGKLTDERKEKIKKNANKASLKSALGAAKGVGLAALSSTSFGQSATQSASQGIKSSYGAYVNAVNKSKQDEEKQKAEQDRIEDINRQERMIGAQVANVVQNGGTDKVKTLLSPQDAATVDAFMDANKDFKGTNDHLGDISQNSEVTATNVVSIKGDTKVLRENSDDSLLLQLDDSKTLDNINRNIEVTSKTVAKINNEVETIAGDTAKIVDNTTYSGIESLENMKEYDKSVTRKTTVKVDNEISYENGSTTINDATSSVDVSHLSKGEDQTFEAKNKTTVKKINEINYEDGSTTISDTTSGVDVSNLSKGTDQTFETKNKTTVKEINEVETLQENNTSSKKGSDSSNKGPGNKKLLDE